MEKISKDDVRYVAKLAELEFGDKEVEKFTSQLVRILDHIAKIGSADTKGVPPTSHVLDVKNVYREDIARESISQESALGNAPDRESGGFKVPKID
jgi:aspartyl-tRNA(Asn)/glutamyl-tRNA(Gln) amidotransferase subunit C